jgi:hypothetical protein
MVFHVFILLYFQFCFLLFPSLHPQSQVMRLVDPPSALSAARDESLGYDAFRSAHPIASDFSSTWIAPYEARQAHVMPGPKRGSGSGGSGGSGGSAYVIDEPFRDFKQEATYRANWNEQRGMAGRGYSADASVYAFYF